MKPPATKPSPEALAAAAAAGITDALRLEFQGYVIDRYLTIVCGAIRKHDPNHMILGPSNGPDGSQGRIEETGDGGKTWQLLAGPWSFNMVERFAQVDRTLFAVMSGGGLYAASLDTLSWEPVLADVTGVNDLASMAVP